ncbi:PREDICTED: glycine-rich RNA-binding protein 2, mitochondrial-like isoform X3 [Populus euphratica]|uniref:Glycine-rich RNA-binding protein 2, mitochondrial-like isoform X3 n=1 Tax=Populus euphratica TaxID=75702 RepID=A0AAJ6T3Q8_POPEU|nr:PREDICTED: glycine-rich RNA-binding protein 2, mitochondrial-like isoform X3 [Populus euphratica]XP_011003621.1 PREDICTED: glycine-rich RNA-binding protein 2, mitochondrial-like isoform X3 [Populus euphratica]XP_011003622.1 PREDICTED: glycine-rich RNA-binding protein 2, mitochondrial-like isoform X3 [Populus euphratica]
MAFFNKLGSLARQSISQKGQVPMVSMVNSIRCMSSSKLFIGGLPWSTDDQTLKDAFSGFGEVTEARVIMDRETGRSRGFGFVRYDSIENASEALSAMDGQNLGGRTVRVSFAEERRPPQSYNDNHQGSQGFDN